MQICRKDIGGEGQGVTEGGGEGTVEGGEKGQEERNRKEKEQMTKKYRGGGGEIVGGGWCETIEFPSI